MKTKWLLPGKKLILFLIIAAIICGAAWVILAARSHQSDGLDSFHARPFSKKVHLTVSPKGAPAGMTPAEIKQAYSISGAGKGTIAIVDAYDDPGVEKDLNTFSKKFGIAACTAKNGCFEKHKMASGVKASAGWASEIALDVEWAHAVAPGAKILLVEAVSDGGTNLLKAVDYARKRKDVVAVSMSWGGDEFAGETKLESHFASPYGATFFASSGDDGHGASWPAVSANVIAVGGTTLNLNSSGKLMSETAWNGSGGGVSDYIAEPALQGSYDIRYAKGRRAVPDVAYDANPSTGYPVYSSLSDSGSGWFEVGGTSAGSPQWAALRTISKNISLDRIYAVKTKDYFRDVATGANGTCRYFCHAKKGYDFVTGLGSPINLAY